MPSIERIEKQIYKLEGFKVRIRHLDGRDVRGDRSEVPGWPYERAAREILSVSEWKKTRFHKRYPGFTVDVLNGDDSVAHGKNSLSKVRNRYGD
jgi:hypothetical protein